MAEQRRENSLLISLRELKSIEDDRVQEEEDAKKAAEEAERRAKEDAIRRVKEEEERKIREAEDKVRREREEKERQIREEQLRLEEAERRARIDAQAKLEEARIQAEARIRVAKAPPVRLIIGITLGVLLVSGGFLAFVINKHREEAAIAQRESDERLRKEREKAAAEREALAAEQRAQAQKMADLQKQLGAATSEVEKEKLRRQMEDTRRESARRQSAIKKTGKGDGKIDTSSDDPLGGTLPGL